MGKNKALAHHTSTAVSPFGLGVYEQKKHECDVFKLLGLLETYLVPRT